MEGHRITDRSVDRVDYNRSCPTITGITSLTHCVSLPTPTFFSEEADESLAAADALSDEDPQHFQPQAATLSSCNSDPAVFEGEPSLETMANEWERKCAVDVARCMVCGILGHESVMDMDDFIDTRHQDTDTDPDCMERMRLEIVKAQTCIAAPRAIGDETTSVSVTNRSPARLRLLRKTPSTQLSAASVSSEAGLCCTSFNDSL